MHDVILSLNKEVGVKGSMIVSRDGVVIVSDIAPPLDSDLVAAIATDSIRRINASLRELRSNEFTKFLFNSTYGRMIFIETGDAYLVVILDKSINVDFTMMSISSAARKIRNLGSMT